MAKGKKGEKMIKALAYYGAFAIEWYFCALLAFLGIYGIIALKSSFRKLASLMLLFNSALPALLICGMLTEDLKTIQAMAITLMLIQTAIAITGLTVIKKTIPMKLYRNADKKEKSYDRRSLQDK